MQKTFSLNFLCTCYQQTHSIEMPKKKYFFLSGAFKAYMKTEHKERFQIFGLVIFQTKFNLC